MTDLQKAGIFTGKSTDRFNLKNKITSAETAKIIATLSQPLKK